MAENRDADPSRDASSPDWHRRLRTIGLAALTLGLVGLLASFPFIYGDPSPGQVATDPPWFMPVAWASVLLIGLGGAFLVAPAVHRMLSRHTKS